MVTGAGVIHTAFDIAAWVGGFCLGRWAQRRWLRELAAPSLLLHPTYFASAITGALIGAFSLGTLNMALSGTPGLGRSIVGALFGAIVGVEAYKAVRGVTGSTGVSFVVPLSFGIGVGRIGCFLSGMDDFTYGVPTSLPWGWDFGDGAARHPVQVYKSLSMLLFLLWFLSALHRRSPLALRHGFHLFIAFYALQRFCWEFLKPYGPVAGPLNLFHMTCLLMIIYSVNMMLKRTTLYAR